MHSQFSRFIGKSNHRHENAALLWIVHLSERELKNATSRTFDVLLWIPCDSSCQRTTRSRNESFYKIYTIATSWNIFWKSIHLCRIYKW